MASAVITIDDVLGPLQIRKIFSDKDPADIDIEMTGSSDEEGSPGQRSCKQCNNGKTLLTCDCYACAAWRALSNQLVNKRPSPWPGALDVLENFCKRQRTVEEQHAGSGVIPGSASADPHGETSKSGAGVIPAPHTGAPSSSAAQPKAKAAPVPRHPLQDIVWNRRRFDEAEDGQKYMNKGPGNLVAFRAETKKAKGYVQDWGIEVISNNGEEVRYGPQTNTKENFVNIARHKSDSRNKVIVIDCDQTLLAVTFEEEKYRSWTVPWYMKRRITNLSHFFSGFLRHWGCTWKGNQRCDSGGWFLWMEVSKMLCHGYKERACEEAAAFHDVEHDYHKGGSTPVFMLRALVPANAHEKTRFQLAVEINHATGRFLRPLAVRACSGQQYLKQLDPSRYAAVATKELISKLPGLFHITLQSNVAAIVAHGLKPGHLSQTYGRVDVHFSPFPPHDKRNEMMRDKLRSIGRTSAKWVVISVNPLKCPKDSLRFCLANNIVLSSATIPSSAFDGIWTLSWSDQPVAQQRWLYEPRLESFSVTHFRGDHTYTDAAIADLISVGAAARAHIVGECRESSAQRMAHYQKAKNAPILANEQGAHEGIPLRRCPACLDATPSRMTYCLCCNAEFLGQYHGEGHRHGQAASAAPYRVPPKAPDIKSHQIQESIECSPDNDPKRSREVELAGD